jgi:hypothetical protein
LSLAACRAASTVCSFGEVAKGAFRNEEQPMNDAGSPHPERVPFRLDLGRVGVFVALPVVLWAFYTTSSGMIDIMSQGPDDHIGALGAVVGSAAVLAMLALTSWSLGTDLAALLTRRSAEHASPLKVLVVGTVFLFVFSFSAFFSFTYYYKNIFALSSKQIEGEQQPFELATTMITATGKKIDAAYADVSTKIKGGAASWIDSINSLIKVAGASGANLRDAVGNAQAENRKTAETTAKTRSELTVQLQTAKRDLADAKADISKLEGSIADLMKIIDPKREEIRALLAEAKSEDQLAADAEKGLDNLGKGCGDNCRAHQGKALAARDKIKTIEASLIKPEKDFKNQTEQKEKKTASIPILTQKVESLQSQLDSTSVAKPADVPTDVAGTIKALIEANDGFRKDPTWPAARAIKPSCDVLLKALRQAKMELDVAPDFNCELQASDEARQLLMTRDSVITGRTAFAKQCGLSENSSLQGSLRDLTARIRTNTLAPEKGLDEADKLVTPCIKMAKAAGLSDADVQGLLREEGAFVRNNTFKRNKFELAREAFWSGTPDATMAIGIAVAQDSFILILKLLAEIFGHEAKPRAPVRFDAPIDLADRSGEGAEVRALKLLLREAKPLRGDSSSFDLVQAGAGLPADVRENLVAPLNRMVRERTARIVSGDTYRIDNSVLREVEVQLRAHARSIGEIPTTAETESVREEQDGGSTSSETTIRDTAQGQTTGLDQFFRPKNKSNGDRDHRLKSPDTSPARRV